MNFSEDEIDLMAAVLQAQTRSFAELVRIAKLDPTHDLVDADVCGVDFGTDDLTGFSFAGAHLIGANLSRARGLTPEMFSGAIRDDSTQWPSGFWDNNANSG